MNNRSTHFTQGAPVYHLPVLCPSLTLIMISDFTQLLCPFLNSEPQVSTLPFRQVGSLVAVTVLPAISGSLALCLQFPLRWLISSSSFSCCLPSTVNCLSPISKSSHTSLLVLRLSWCCGAQSLTTGTNCGSTRIFFLLTSVTRCETWNKDPLRFDVRCFLWPR